jgi:hypothetical protein
MIGKFISFGIFSVIIAGLALRFDVPVPSFLDWAGTLPGDLIMHKGNSTIFLPFSTAAVISAALCLLDSLITPKK